MPSSDYTSVLSREAIAVITSPSKSKQQRVLDIADRIEFSPEHISDSRIYDSEGHLVESVLIVNYWIDHAVRKVRITEIHVV